MGKLAKSKVHAGASSSYTNRLRKNSDRLRKNNAPALLSAACVSSKPSLVRQTSSNQELSENGHLPSSSSVLRVVTVGENEDFSEPSLIDGSSVLHVVPVGENEDLSEPSSIDGSSVLRVVPVDWEEEGDYEDHNNYVKWIENTKRSLPISEKNNSLPVLHNDNGDDLVSEVVGPIKKMQIIDAGDLRPILDELSRSPKKYRKVLQTLHKECIEFLTSKDRNAIINRLVVVDKNPQEGPPRGWALRAAEDLKCLQFLGFYSGRFHPNEESLRLAKKQDGSRIIGSYVLALERASDDENEFTVNPYRTGNALCVMNTAQYINAPAWTDNTGQLVQNNVGMFRFGVQDEGGVSLIGLFIMLKDGVPKGKELLFSYGPDFNPHQDYEKSIKNDPPSIKEEPEEQ